MPQMPIRDAIGFLIFIFMLILNIIRLRRAVRFRRAVKDKECVRVTAEIISAYGSVRGYLFATRYASACYNIDGKPVIGKMICSHTEGMFKLRKNQNAEVIVNRRFPTMFAFSEKQVRRSFREYLTYVIIASVAVAVFGFAFFVELCHYI